MTTPTPTTTKRPYSHRTYVYLTLQTMHPSRRYLGYSTDNGAFYYYTTEAGKNYEDTMLDVATYAKTAGIPYQYVLK